ncbi:MAG: hydrogenase iron-sulfur subunit [Candidatus Krumholzibacteriota bacterium]
MGDPSKSGERFEPAVAGFFCEQCGADCLSKAGESNGEYPDSLKSVRIICAEKVGPDLIRQSFEHGADGVIICGCLVGRCKTMDDNAQVLAHIHRSKLVLNEMGIAQGRLRQEWICSPEVENVRDIVADFVEHVRQMGPLKIPIS